MNIKVRLSLLFVGTFLLILSVILFSIYFSNADFRKNEFFERLEHRARNIANILMEKPETDQFTFNKIDQFDVGRMHQERIIVFDNEGQVIYKNGENINPGDLLPAYNKIRQEKTFEYLEKSGLEQFGLEDGRPGQQFVIIISAYDLYGRRKLTYLQQVILLSFIIGAIFIFVPGYFFIREVFKPIDRLNQSIQTINEQNLHTQLPLNNTKDELNQLAMNYNQMLMRLKLAFDTQSVFVQNASHELKTPLARISTQVEKALGLIPGEKGESHELLERALVEIKNQGEVIESLLLLQRLQSMAPIQKQNLRLDELFFQAQEEIFVQFPNLLIHFDLDATISNESQLMIFGNPILLKICFTNLMKNAALYSMDNKVGVVFWSQNKKLCIRFSNAGQSSLDEKSLFQAFRRGENTGGEKGYGLGLSIVKRIIEIQGGTVTYSYDGKHNFNISLKQV